MRTRKPASAPSSPPVWSHGAAGDAVWTSQVLLQLKSIVFTAIFCPVLTLVILFALRALFGNLRASEEGEATGLDLTEHSESAYALGGLSTASEARTERRADLDLGAAIATPSSQKPA